jgi:hypothetical protein
MKEMTEETEKEMTMIVRVAETEVKVVQNLENNVSL